MEPQLSDRAAFITGGGSGLGRAICQRLAARGDHVVVADRDLEGAGATADLINRAGDSAAAVLLDVTDADQVEAVIAAADRSRPLTTVVNNAGIAAGTPLLNSGMADFDRIFAVNVRGAYAVLRAAAAVMVPWSTSVRPPRSPRRAPR